MRTTMKDIAEVVGVSTMAVSVVLSGSANQRVSVSPAKAERIRQVALELRYRPNQNARSLKTRRTNQVAVVFQHFSELGPEHPYHMQVLNGFTSALFPAGYAMTLCPKIIVNGDAFSMSDGRFDGVLWCRPEFDEASFEAIMSSSVPVVMMHVPPGLMPSVPSFCADNDGAMRQVVEHLCALGHRRLAFVIDPVSMRSVEGEARSKAFVKAAIQVGLGEPEVIVLGRDHSTLARYRDADSPHTALACFSDELAGFVLRSCESLGVRVPADLSVVGFDSSQFCEGTKPRLTSVSQPVTKMAHAAATHLLSLIHDAEHGLPRSLMASCLYECALEVRDSTGPARS